MIAGRKRQQTEPMAPAHHREGRLRGAQLLHRSDGGRRPGERAGVILGPISCRSRNDQRGEAAEGRHPGPFPFADLDLVEAFGIAGDERPDDGVVGREGLEDADAATERRPARPVTCASSWKVRSDALGSPEERPRSASTTPTSVSFGKVWPLATSCVPTMMSHSPRATASSSALRRWTRRACRRRAPRSAARAAASPTPPRCVRRRGAGDETVERPAGRARLRPRLQMTAMVTGEPSAERWSTSQEENSSGIRTVAAGAAERQRRIAAPVEEEQRLFAARRGLGDGRDEPGARNRPFGGPPLRMSIAIRCGMAAPVARAVRTMWR